MKQVSYKKIDGSLRQSLDKLWDDCFGDLPLMQQRVLKVFAMRQSKEAYQHRQHEKIELKDWKDVAVNVDENHFLPDSEQVKTAQQVVDEIVKEFTSGKSRAARYLRYFLKDKKIKISVCKDLGYDAGFDGYNPLMKEIYIDLCAGCFYSKENPRLVNKDNLAVTIGHELGHMVETSNRNDKCEAQTVHSNSWEIESFCDMFGYRLVSDAGYSLSAEIELLKKGINEKREPKQPNPHPPLKNRLELALLCQKMFVNEDRKVTPFDEKITTIEWNAQVVETKIWNELKKLIQKTPRS